MSALLARAHHLAWRAANRVSPGAAAVYGGVALGVVSRGGLHAIDQAVYDAWPAYGGDEHNLRGLFPWEETAIGEYFAGARRVRVIGAGGGREVLALWQRGMEVEGYECNPNLRRAAAELLPRHGCDAPVHPIARDAAPADVAPRDGAIVGWSAYTLIAGRERRVELLRGLRRGLPAGAPLLLSFFTRDEGDARALRPARIANLARAIAGRERAEPGDVLAPNFIHRFTRGEVEAEMAAGGFRMQRYEAEGAGRFDSGWAVGRAE